MITRLTGSPTALELNQEPAPPRVEVGRPLPGASHSADADLLRRMAAGDEAALGLFYDRWSPVLYPLILHLVGDAHDAEEVLEETLWQAWRSADRYETGRGSVVTWLGMMARSRALDRIRSRARVREEVAGESILLVAEDPDRPSADPLRDAELAEERRMVRDALSTLPAEQREVLELAYFGGLSQTEVAERTGEPLGTVKTRTRLALQKLRDALAVLRRGRR